MSAETILLVIIAGAAVWCAGSLHDILKIMRKRGGGGL